MANEGRISSFDGAALTHPELRVVGHVSVPPPQLIEWNGVVSQSADDAQENIGAGGVVIINGASVLIGSTAGLNRFLSGFQFLVDVDSLPANAQIVEATLSLNVILIGPGPPVVDIYAEPAADAALFTIVAGDISSRNFIGPLFAECPAPIVMGRNEIDVTELVRHWHSIGGAEDNRIAFIAKERTGAVGARISVTAWDAGTPDLNARLSIKFAFPSLV